MHFDADALKKEFPFFESHPDWIYLDTAATAQKPNCVIDTMSNFYKKDYATVHRAAHLLSYKATELFENAREKIASFMGVTSDELIFTKGTTEALNLLASSLLSHIHEGDEILVLETEHHANLLPWQELCKKTKAKLIKIPVLDSGIIDLETFKNLKSDKTKVVAIAHMSNVTGALQPLKKIKEQLLLSQALLIVDGAQGICHKKINLIDLDVDAYAFSSHKLYGPTGLGCLFVKANLIDELDLYQVGGDVIDYVSFDETSYKKGRYRFETGTPMIAEVIGLHAAIDFLEKIGMDNISLHEKMLGNFLKKELQKFENITLIGDSSNGLVSFFSHNIHSLDIATFLDSKKIAIRSGHLCAQPALKRFHTPHAARISCGLYTSISDLEKTLEALEEAVCFFG